MFKGNKFWLWFIPLSVLSIGGNLNDYSFNSPVPSFFGLLGNFVGIGLIITLFMWIYYKRKIKRKEL